MNFLYQLRNRWLRNEFSARIYNHFNLIGGNKLLYASILIGCCILVWAPIDLVGWPKAYFNQGSTDRRLQGPIYFRFRFVEPWYQLYRQRFRWPSHVSGVQAHLIRLEKFINRCHFFFIFGKTTVKILFRFSFIFSNRDQSKSSTISFNKWSWHSPASRPNVTWEKLPSSKTIFILDGLSYRKIDNISISR